MNSDIRVSTTFFFHRKTKKLRQSLKDHGVLCLLKLWTRVAVEKPCGILKGWDIEDIELEADFEGETGKFVSELLRLDFLDEKDGVYILHNWNGRQGWVSKSTERGDKARLSRMAKTHRDIYEKLVGDGYKGITRIEYDQLTINQQSVNDSLTIVNESVTPAPSPAPSPSPSPSPKKKKVSIETLCPHQKIIALYHQCLPELPEVREWNDPYQSYLKTRWKEKQERQNLEWWKDFFLNNIKTSNFLMGRKKDFQANLGWIVCKSNFTKILNGQYRNHGPKTGSTQTDNNIRAAQAFLERDEDE